MKRLVIIFMMLLMLPLPVYGEDEAIYTLLSPDGEKITQINHTPSTGDEYIASDNQHYRIENVNEATQTARLSLLGAYVMPDVSWLDHDAALEVSGRLEGKRIAMYCTHSDESYVPTDGTESREKGGGIYDVARELAYCLSSRGVEAIVDTTNHNPHDAGAYRRSRQTAAQLVKRAPDAIFDIHRDGIPDPDQYALRMGGENLSKIRLLVGRGNQNASANKAFAVKLKAVADKVYPGLIKDIYMGKGVYNQDLYPRSVLLEMGTHTVSKERVLKSTEPMADVIYRTLYGGVVGSAGASDVSMNNTPPVRESNEGSGTGIVWLLGIAVIGGGLMALLSTGSIKKAGEKIKRTASEATGGLIGKKPQK
ncbi:MAG: stage II sporulation protein P [Clostridia bacterium]|nr:stage II sporulation protein P [Clostridia bacterium]